MPLGPPGSTRGFQQPGWRSGLVTASRSYSTYAKCIVGQEEAARHRIADAMNDDQADGEVKDSKPS
jgi:hypothetical protein